MFSDSYLERCEVTPICIVGTIDRMDRCDIYCGKLVFKTSLCCTQLASILYLQL